MKTFRITSSYPSQQMTQDMRDYRCNFLWFQRNVKMLVSRYPDMFVAVSGEAVAAVSSDKDVLMKRFRNVRSTYIGMVSPFNGLRPSNP